MGIAEDSLSYPVSAFIQRHRIENPVLKTLIWQLADRCAAMAWCRQPSFSAPSSEEREFLLHCFGNSESMLEILRDLRSNIERSVTESNYQADVEREQKTDAAKAEEATTQAIDLLLAQGYVVGLKLP